MSNKEHPKETKRILCKGKDDNYRLSHSFIKLQKDTTYITRMNSRIKGAFAKLAEKKGLTMAEYFQRLIIKELQKEGVEVTIEVKVI